MTTSAREELRATGCLVRPGVVLTAAHVVGAAASVAVFGNPDEADEWSAAAVEILAAERGEIAVVRLESGRGPVTVEPAGFGGLLDQVAAVVPCVVVGYPLFKLRADGATDPLGGRSDVRWFRDRVQATGRIPVLSNSRTHTLEIITDPPAEARDLGRSPWEGMSGAGVWVGDRIVGVITEHHRADSRARLTAARIDCWLADAASTGSDVALRAALGLPASAADLPDVLPRLSADALAGGYLAQVRDVLPIGGLLDRARELADLVTFCAGDQPYAWWQAGPWAGKSALAAHLVLHPPAGVEVVCFFVTSRWAGHADSEAFTSELTRQLAHVAGEPEPAVNTPAARYQALRHLLDAATSRVAERGRRLLLVVDGLDEDQSRRPGGGWLPSIASLLPLRPTDAVRVLVTGRPHPGLPEDVDPAHPLRRVAPRRLDPSPHAAELGLHARAELAERRASSDRRHVDVLGYLTAAGGGLTRTDLTHLTGIPGWELDGLFGSAFGRTLRGRTVSGDHAVYLFAHETLHAEAERLFADDLRAYRQGIHDWADTHRDRRWPDPTPRYLLSPYGRLLAAVGDVSRLAVLAADPYRHDRMYACEYSDATALEEIRVARAPLLAAPRADLAALGALAVAELRLSWRNTSTPAGLPAVWAALGQTDRAERLARALTDPAARARALAGVAQALTANPPHAADLFAEAERIGSAEAAGAENQDWALAGVVAAMAGSDPAGAERVAAAIDNPAYRVKALTAVAAATGAAAADRRRQLHQAQDAARTISLQPILRKALGRLLKTVALVDPAEADRMTEQAPGDFRAVALAGLARHAQSTDNRRANELAAEAERTAAALRDSSLRETALADIAPMLATVDAERAVRLARAINHPRARARTLADVAHAVAAADPGQARTLAAEAERVAQAVDDTYWRARVLADIAAAAAAVDADLASTLADEAEQLSRRFVLDKNRLPNLLVHLAQAVASIDPTRAERAAQGIDDADQRAATMAEIAKAAAGTDVSHGERIARQIADPYWQAMALTRVAVAAAAVDPDDARRLAGDAEQQARTLTDPRERSELLVEMVRRLAAVNPDHAERLCRDIDNPPQRAKALTIAASTVAAADPPRAARLLRHAEPFIKATELARQPFLFRLIAPVLAAVAPERVVHLAKSIPDSHMHDLMVDDIALDTAKRSPRHAERVIRIITDPDDRDSVAAQAAVRAAPVDPACAERLARSIPADMQAKTWAAVSAAMAATDPARAATIARAIRHPTSQQRAMADVVVTAASIDDDRAHELAAELDLLTHITADPDRLDASTSAAITTAMLESRHALQQPEDVELLTRVMNEPRRRAAALADIAVKVATANPERARRLTDMIPDIPHRHNALAEIAHRLAETDPAHAHAAALAITDPARREEVLLHIARKTATSAASIAGPILAPLLTPDNIIEELRTLAPIDPAATLEIYDHIMLCLNQ